MRHIQFSDTLKIRKGLKMDINDCLEKLKDLGWIAKPCASFNGIGIRSYIPDTNERMRMGSSGELYIKDNDGWMYQIGTLEDIKTGIIDKELRGDKQ